MLLITGVFPYFSLKLMTLGDLGAHDFFDSLRWLGSLSDGGSFIYLDSLALADSLPVYGSIKGFGSFVYFGSLSLADSLQYFGSLFTSGSFCNNGSLS